MHVCFKNYCIWQLVFDNVVEMDVGCEANGPSSTHPSSVFLSYYILQFILLHEKFLQFEWLRALVIQLNLKYLHVKITNFLRVVV